MKPSGLIYGLCLFLIALVSSTCAAQQGDAAAQEPVQLREGRLIRVPLPLTDAAGTIRQIRRAVEQLPDAVAADKRAVIVLEFDVQDENSGRGSDLGASFSLAEFLVSEELSRVRTVAWIPGSDKPVKLVGHAILPVIGCSQIAMGPQASIGDASVDLKIVQPLHQEIYKGIAGERLTLPEAIVIAMLDPAKELFRAVADGQPVYVTGAELDKLEAENTKTLTVAGDPLVLSSDQLLEYRLIPRATASQAELARQLEIAPAALEPVAVDHRDWVAIKSVLPGVLDHSSVSWLVRSIKGKLSTGSDMVILEFGEMRGDWDSSLQLAEYLASLDSDRYRTVAWVSGNCKGTVGVAALACDHVIFGPEGVLGMPDYDPLTEIQLETLDRAIGAVAKEKDCDRSLMMAVANPNMKIHQYRNAKSGATRILSSAEYDEQVDADQWNRVDPVDVIDGIDVKLAERLEIARTVAATDELIESYYQLESTPVPLQATSSDKFLEKLASFLTDPVVSMFLVMFGFVCIMNEIAAPGLGAFGFLGVLFLAAFFWSHHLDGSAAWFEILMFVVGLAFLAIEIFVVPGFGLFGIGGIIMMVLSLMMACQSFVVIPQTKEQLAEIPMSLLPIFGAFAGVVVGAVVLRKVLPHAPFFRQLMLEPPQKSDQQLLGGADPEAIADFGHLQGRTGVVVTPLMPSGKARIGGKVYDVIADGQAIEKGEKIEVIEAVANRVVVRKISD